MAMKNFVIPNLEWNNHHSRHRSSASRVSSKHRQSRVVQSPLRLESVPESSNDRPSACDGLMLSSPRRHSPIRRSSSTEDDDTEEDDTVALLSSKSKKSVIEYRRQPRNSVLKNGLLQCDQIDGVEKIEGRKNGSVLGDKGSKSLKISIPIQKKNNDTNGSEMEIIEGRKEIGAMMKEDGERIVDMEVEDEGKVIGFMAVEEEGKEIGVLAEEKGKGKDIGVSAAEEEGKDIGAMEEEELAAKPWNFRPRNPIRKSLNLNGSEFNFCRRMVTSKCTSQKKQEVEKKEQVEKKKEPLKKEDKKKRCLTIALTKEEIKEDLSRFGLRPSKKPMKRSKSVQKQLMNIFPGTALDSIPITADLYRVSRKDVGLV